MDKSLLVYNKPKSKKNKKVFIFAHGAGAPMDSDWMNQVSEGLASRGITVIRFEFPYMQERRENGKKRPPNTKKVLLETWHQVLELVGEKEVFIGGKSMGGRMASLMADEAQVQGLICLGFPFHAPGKGPKDRIDHLKNLKTPTLICQGTRDSMGTKEDISGYALSKMIQFHWLEDGDHSLKPRKASGFTQDEHLESTCDAIAAFMQ
jgi:predicted alpha/beta-hydrolase family hydrolase